MNLPWKNQAGPASFEAGQAEPTEVAEGSIADKTDVTVQTQAIQELKVLEMSHQFDPNLPEEKIDALREATKSNNIEKIILIEREFTEDSPYDSVRAAVRPTDGGEVANTLRAWMLGFFFVTVSAVSPTPQSFCKVKHTLLIEA